LSFVNDSDVIGTWTTVDFVNSPEVFNPKKRESTGEMFLNEMTFLENGQIKQKYGNDEGRQNIDIPRPWFSWTKDYVIHKGAHTLSKYDIREINGSVYMFFEWKSGDYIYFHKKPSYYVLKKEAV
jgi:bla regulator protein BlaR1